MQGAMLGNTAFLTDVTDAVDSRATTITVTIRNDATISGGARDYFWPGQTRVFVELLPLMPGNLTFAALPDFEGVQWTHQVWPLEVLTEARLQAGMPDVMPQVRAHVRPSTHIC